MKEEWKFVWEESGGQCVKIHGTTRMLRWSADSWDTVQKVIIVEIVLVFLSSEQLDC